MFTWYEQLAGSLSQPQTRIHIQKRAIRVVYSDTDSDYEIALIVAGMDSLKDRREMLMARFFKRQVLASNALLHYLLPERRDNDTIRSLRNSQPFPSIRARTNKFYTHWTIKNVTFYFAKAVVLIGRTTARRPCGRQTIAIVWRRYCLASSTHSSPAELPWTSRNTGRPPTVAHDRRLPTGTGRRARRSSGVPTTVSPDGQYPGTCSGDSVDRQNDGARVPYGWLYH